MQVGPPQDALLEGPVEELLEGAVGHVVRGLEVADEVRTLAGLHEGEVAEVRDGAAGADEAELVGQVLLEVEGVAGLPQRVGLPVLALGVLEQHCAGQQHEHHALGFLGG